MLFATPLALLLLLFLISSDFVGGWEKRRQNKQGNCTCWLKEIIIKVSSLSLSISPFLEPTMGYLFTFSFVIWLFCSPFCQLLSVLSSRWENKGLKGPKVRLGIKESEGLFLPLNAALTNLKLGKIKAWRSLPFPSSSSCFPNPCIRPDFFSCSAYSDPSCVGSWEVEKGIGRVSGGGGERDYRVNKKEWVNERLGWMKAENRGRSNQQDKPLVS